jgi:hypothetical protein
MGSGTIMCEAAPVDYPEGQCAVALVKSVKKNKEGH